MQINIIGGGPSGLYFALLMKQQDPTHSITVFERNAPDATFGWGVVFSDKTLSYLRDADARTYVQIIANFETWDNVDVVHRDAKISIRGNKFSGIGRLKLLRILQNRCQELGVTLKFETDIVSIDPLADCDFLVGADGINSAVRQRYAEAFKPELSVRSNKYIWYGTRQLFHGLTLTFRESDAGAFAAHSYKFNKRTSTFIVECDPDTWNAAGFARKSDDETRAYLQEVFAKDLGGHELLSNNSKWINFVNVRNQRWRHRNVVLLGDALHTAHFSIGSGTKLALEDSIALARCFSEYTHVETALQRFEEVRRPVIEEYQAAALESLQWFENVRSFMHLEPYDLAYSLMTRSKKIDHENLRRRDPAFIAAYEASLKQV
jgi:2-polyprenyl-6-methoxyphenol hydroxylase-like FAD-dependent oxidoreductase